MTGAEQATGRPRVLCLGRGYAIRFAAWILRRSGFDVVAATPDAASTGHAVPLSEPLVHVGPDAVAARLREADVCITDSPEILAAVLGGGREPWPSDHVRLALVELGPPAACEDANATIAELCGLGAVIGQADGPGLSPPARMLEALVGLQAATAGLAAFLGARRDGVGEHVRIDPVTCLATVSGPQAMQFLNYDRRWLRSGPSASGSGGPYPFRMFACSDGAVVIICRSRAEWESFLAMLGDPAWSRRPEFADPVRVAERHADEVSELVSAELAGWTVAEAVDTARRHRVPLATLRTVDDALADPLLFTTPPVPIHPVDVLRRGGRHSGWSVRGARPAAARGPLAGLRVLDLGWVWAAPMATAWLADLGADVIKVESSDRLDVGRRRGMDFPASSAGARPALPGYEQPWLFQAANRNKRSLRLELKDDADRTAFLALVARADVIVESFSSGVLERLAVAPDVLFATNPDVLLLSMGGRTVDGGYLARSYAPMLTALAGIESQIADPDGAPLGLLNWGVADPNAGAWATYATVCALARDEGGAQLLVSQLRALVNTCVSVYLGADPPVRQFPAPEEVTLDHLLGVANGPLGDVYRNAMAHSWAPTTGHRWALGAPWRFRRMEVGVRSGAPLLGAARPETVLEDWT